MVICDMSPALQTEGGTEVCTVILGLSVCQALRGTQQILSAQQQCQVKCYYQVTGAGV